MGKVREAVVSFIPRHVRSRSLLNVYRFFSLFRVPGYIRERHYRENRSLLGQENSAFLENSKGYIENQAQWEEVLFGVGRRSNMGYAGCEIIATYNALKALGGSVSGTYMAELIRVYEARGAALMGKFGVTPTAIAGYFRKNGFWVETAYGEDAAAAASIGRKFTVMIATACNDKNDITAQIHTVCITENQDGKYVLHNAYIRDGGGRYKESAPYETMQEAVRHISRREPKLVYLIGIGKKGGNTPFVGESE